MSFAGFNTLQQLLFHLSGCVGLISDSLSLFAGFGHLCSNCCRNSIGVSFFDPFSYSHSFFILSFFSAYKDNLYIYLSIQSEETPLKSRVKPPFLSSHQPTSLTTTICVFTSVRHILAVYKK